MANFSKATYGEGSTKGVNLVVSAYDNGAWSKEGKDKDGNDVTRSGHFVQQAIHPDDPRAAGQVFLGLKSVPQEDGRYNKNENLYPSQMEALIAAAGDNTSPLLNKDGERVGTNYGVKADVMFAGGKADKDGNKSTRYALLNSKTLEPSELSVAEIDGKTIHDRMFESQAEAKAARDAAREQGKDAPQAQAQAEAAQEQVEAVTDEPELG